jgi:hypothetical protein
MFFSVYATTRQIAARLRAAFAKNSSPGPCISAIKLKYISIATVQQCNVLNQHSNDFDSACVASVSTDTWIKPNGVALAHFEAESKVIS